MSDLDLKATARAAAARLAHSDVEAPHDKRRDIARPDGPSSLALTRRFLGGGDAPHFFVRIERDHYPIAHVKILGEHTYVISDPEMIVEIFIGHGRDTMKGRGLQGAKALLGNGLLTSEGDVHLRQRRLVQPAFHKDRIAAYSVEMTALTEQHEKSWVDGEEVDMSMSMSALTLAIVGRTLFGADLTGDAKDVGLALDNVLKNMAGRLVMGPTLLRIPSPGRNRALASSAQLDAVVQRMIDEHRAAGDTGDMLSMLIASQEDGVGMTDAQVRDEAMTLVLAGHETTAMTMSWTWMLLSQNPAKAAWLHEELDSVLGGRTPTMDDLPHLPRTRAVIAESIRLYPPAWIQGRRLLTDLEIGGWTLPAGATTLISQYAMHRSPRWWASSLTYLPERWLTAEGTFSEEAPGQPRGAWFPFGWGNRKCIGEGFAWTEASLLLATLAQRWQPQLIPGRPITPQAAVTLRQRNGMPMILRKR